jgi:hypothetical protein
VSSSKHRAAQLPVIALQKVQLLDSGRSIGRRSPPPNPTLGREQAPSVDRGRLHERASLFPASCPISGRRHSVSIDHPDPNRVFHVSPHSMIRPSVRFLSSSVCLAACSVNMTAADGDAGNRAANLGRTDLTTSHPSPYSPQPTITGHEPQSPPTVSRGDQTCLPCRCGGVPCPRLIASLLPSIYRPKDI